MKSLKKGRTIKVGKGETVDNALKRLKAKLTLEGIMDDMKAHRTFENPAKKKLRKSRTMKQRNAYPWNYDKREEIILQ